MRHSVSRSVTKVLSVQFDCLLAQVTAVTVTTAERAVCSQEAFVNAAAGVVAWSSHRMTVLTKLVWIYVHTMLLYYALYCR